MKLDPEREKRVTELAHGFLEHIENDDIDVQREACMLVSLLAIERFAGVTPMGLDPVMRARLEQIEHDLRKR
jgi:hypothetical protein